MKKIVLVRLDKACDPEVNSLEDVLELMRAPHTDDTCECECKSKKKSDESGISKETLELISAIAKDLGLDASTLKANVIARKRADEEKAKEALYYNGVRDGYEKGFHDVVNFMKSRLGKFIEDLDDMSKWSFKNGKLKEDAIADIKK